MPGSLALARSRDRVERICASTRDAMQLRLNVLDEIRREVGFEAYAWLLTDPETSVGSAPLADMPSLAELPSLIRLKYLTSVNRWTDLADPPVATLQTATAGEPSRSRLWRELLHRYDVRDVASVVMRDRYGCWGFLDLWRVGSSEPFSAAATAYLADITPVVTTALRLSQASTFSVASPHGVEHRPGPVVLLLSPDLIVRGQTPDTEDYLRILVPMPDGRSPVPASAYNVAAQLLAVEAGVDANPPTARVHLAHGLWVTLQAARIGDTAATTSRDIAVTIEETSPGERAGMFTRAFGLSDRERELLRHLVEGADTREVAQRMSLSEHTVQDHLKSIFAKTGTRNRRRLLTRCLGT